MVVLAASTPSRWTTCAASRRTALLGLPPLASALLSAPKHAYAGHQTPHSGAARASTMASNNPGGGGGGGGDNPPKDFAYTHLWVSKDGETHIKECNASGFESKGYSGSPQWVLSMAGSPTKTVLTELPSEFDNPPHVAPGVQMVVCLAGSWFVRTSDGSERTFSPGEVLFQDNVKDSPADKKPTHASGTRGEPCRQLIVQLDWEPKVDNPGPF